MYNDRQNEKKEKKPFDPDRHRCEFRYDGGKRCPRKGTLSRSTLGDGSFYCRSHFFHEELSYMEAMRKSLNPEKTPLEKKFDERLKIEQARMKEMGREAYIAESKQRMREFLGGKNR